MNLTVYSKVKTILSATIVLFLLASCSSATGPGPSSQQAQLAFQLTSTAEAAATATQMVVDANTRLQEAYARSTEIAQASVQGTLTAQDQQINDMVIVNLQADATKRADDAHATATARAAQATERAAQVTEVANFRTATAVKILDDQHNQESSSNMWTIIGMILIFVVAVMSVLGVLFLFWFLWTKISVRVIKHGDQQIVIHFKGSPRDLLDRNKRHMDVEVLYPAPAVPLLPSASPVLIEPAETMRVTDRGKMVEPVEKMAPGEKSRVLVEWEKWVAERGQPFVEMAFVTARELGNMEVNTIPHWKTIKERYDMMSGRWWTDVTNVLREIGALSKEPGKQNVITLKDRPTIADLAMVSARGKLFPLSPTAGWKESRKIAGNSTEQDSLEQAERAEQRHPTYVDPEWTPPANDAVWALPGN